uniref:Uncharacterized protein n=1 Tax=Xiphophorus couchianus TaxID=32473 RepID=A0A3B5LR94_9TELE
MTYTHFEFTEKMLVKLKEKPKSGRILNMEQKKRKTLLVQQKLRLDKLNFVLLEAQQKNADEGPWLMVNFGNLAWLHHHLGEDEKSEDYLSKVDGLMRKYPAPPELELHPEVLAEKAWTLMKFDKEKKQQALELFQRAIRMQPDTVEWRSSYAILSTEFLTKRQTILEPEVFERLRSAKEQDPGNLYVAALYLEARAAKQEQIHDEARELAERILERPMNGYCGFGPLLRLYRKHISKDEAVEIAIEALRRHPDSRYTKKSSAKCYRKQIFGKQSNPDGSRMDEAICLWDEMIAAHPESGLKDKITLADLHATQQKTKDKADEIYKKLLEEREDLDPAGLQMLYCRYAKHLYFSGHDSGRSIDPTKATVQEVMIFFTAVVIVQMIHPATTLHFSDGLRKNTETHTHHSTPHKHLLSKQLATQKRTVVPWEFRLRQTPSSSTEEGLLEDIQEEDLGI